MNLFPLLAMSGLLAQAKPETEDMAETALDASPSLRLLYSGNLKGVSAERYPFPSIVEIQSNERSGRLQSNDFEPGLIAEVDGWLILAPTLGLREALGQIEEQRLNCKAPKTVQLIENPYEIIITSLEARAQTHKMLSKTEAQTTQWTDVSCQTSDNQSVSLLRRGVTDSLPELKTANTALLRTYSAQLDFGNGAFELLSIGQPSQEFSRNHLHTKSILNNGAYLYVDSGNFVDGASSIVPLGTSLHRPMAYEALADLNPVALGFGQNELIAGVNHFYSEIKPHGLPYIASNWTSKREDLQFPTHRLVTFDHKGTQGEVAFLSIVDPKIHTLVPSLSDDGIQITEPVQAAQEIIDSLNLSPNPPELIVILTTAGADTQESIRKTLKGAHLMIGDSTMATLRIEQRVTEFVNMGAHRKAAPLTVPMDGLAELEVFFESGALKKLQNRPIHITSTMPSDNAVTATITQNRLDHYDDDGHFLLVPENSGSLAQFSQGEWSQLVCESLRQHTQADTVFLRELPEITSIPGAIRQKDIADALSVMDTVEQHRIQGSRFVRFLDQSVGITPVICGTQPGSAFPKARGRSIDPDQMYVVVTTDLTRLGSPLEQTIRTHVKDFKLDPPSQQKLYASNGEPLSLREAVINELVEVNSIQGLENVTPHLLQVSPNSKPPQWLLRSRGLSLRRERFQGMDTDVFSQVPETLATSPSSATLGYTADLAVEYSDSKIIGDLRHQSRFTELTADGVKTEIEDDWTLSTSLTRPSWGLETGSLIWMPYSELLYDSEYTPIEDENGVPSPNRQSDLSIRSGLSTRPWKFVRNIRLAGLANRDMAQLEDKPTEYAALAQLETKVVLRGGLIWSSNAEYLWYGKTQDDDLSDLQVRASGTSQISYPYSRLGSISLYGDALLIKGRLAETSEWGFAYTTGLSIDLIGAITLNR